MTSPFHVKPMTASPPQPQVNEPSETKRRLPDSELSSALNNKRVKDEVESSTEGTREASTTSTVPRRKYKKRKGAANVAARSGDTAPRNSSSVVTMLFRDLDEGPGSIYNSELQVARCLSPRYTSNLTRCASCTRRGAGDTCRFQGIRFIVRDLNKNIIGIAFHERAELTMTCQVDFPTVWNRKLDREHIKRSKLSIAKALLPTLKMEQSHMSNPGIIRRERETVVRVTCDTCITSLFSASFMCRKCGREVCNECFQIVKESTKPTARRKVQEKNTRSSASFLSCSNRATHTFADFTPVTRFAESELRQAVEEMQRILDDAERIGIGSDMLLQGEGQAYTEVITAQSTPVYDDFTPANTPSHVASIPIRRAQVIPASFYDPPSSVYPSSMVNEHVFSSLWEKGLPLLVKDILPRFKLKWNPEYFIKNYGDQSCTTVECQTNLTRNVCVREFFEWFGKYENRTECWKLKDWPPTADFQTAFPELFDDFNNAVPIPDYVRRDGVYNIASHFPPSAVRPDLGPKMYNSMASSQEVGSQGSTRLHMDMADAFNVMLYASACADGSPGYAVWDLFHAEDSDKIRDFLRKKFTRRSGTVAKERQQESQTQAERAAPLPIHVIADHDPIHIQCFYLDVELRRQLWVEYGVKSYRIYQRPGEGVFIPAGCAHQVANMADCMKIAVDFVSPENIDRCEKLTKEFREQNQRKTWKEDVLQLRTMMWFAWQSCSKREMEPIEDDREYDAVG